MSAGWPTSSSRSVDCHSWPGRGKQARQTSIISGTANLTDLIVAFVFVVSGQEGTQIYWSRVTERLVSWNTEATRILTNLARLARLSRIGLFRRIRDKG